MNGAEEPLRAARARLAAQDHAAAAREAERVTRCHPAHPEGWLLAGLAAQGLGRDDRAAGFFLEAARRAPGHPEPWRRLALLRHRTGDAAGAEQAYRQALAAAPADPAIRSNLAALLRATGRAAEAERELRQCLDGQPRYRPAWTNLGNVLADQGRLDEAAEAYRSATRLPPEDGRGWADLARALGALGRHHEAAAAWRATAVLRPGDWHGWAGLGRALIESEALEPAAGAWRIAVRLRPEEGRNWVGLGQALGALERLPEAAAAWRRAAFATPGEAAPWADLADVLFRLADFGGAEACLRRALVLRPEHPRFWHDLGETLLSLRGEAAFCYRHALALEPGDADLRLRLAHLRQFSCDWTGVERLREDIVEPLLGRPTLDGNVGFRLLVLPTAITPGEHLVLARRALATLPRAAPRQPPRGVPHRPLRIGYLSADFQAHATAHLMLGLFGRHDRGRVAVHAYSLGADDGSVYRRRIEADCDAFVDLAPCSDADAARRIAQDSIDILVDLKGPTFGARLGIPARRPAPLQVAWLGYPGSVGVDFLDYVLTDPVVTPPERQADWAERFVLLPGSYQVNDRDQPIAGDAPDRRSAGLPDEGFVFCCFNQLYKIEPLIFGVWMEILRAVPGSVLWLLAGNSQAEANLRREAAARGVEPARLLFAPVLPKDRHLARLRHAGLFLDTYFCNAHTTASDALWAGVPVLTVAGAHFPARVAASLVHAVGMPELALPDHRAYRETAIALAGDPPRLKALRATLAAKRLTAPLFDTDAFARKLETAFEAMWDRHCRGLAPDTLDLTGYSRNSPL